MIALPAVTRANQWRAMACGYVAFMVLYLGAAAVTPSAPRTIAAGALDARVPFLAWTIWIYFTQYALLPAAIVRARDDSDRTHTLYSMLAATAIAAVIFVAWPTQIERQPYTAAGLTGHAWRLLYLLDTPLNCFPSLHVALAAIAGAALWRRGDCVLAVAWPSLIAFSTLTTRQHVVVDVAGGLALAALAGFVTSKLIHHERTHPRAHAARV